MRKEKVVIVALMMLCCFLVPNAMADVIVTGTFTATGTLDVDVNNSAPAFGSIEVSAHSTVPLSLTNNGDVTANVTQDQAVKDSGSMTIGTNGSLNIDQYSVMMDNETTLTDVGIAGGTIVANNLVKDGVKNYNLTVWIASSLSAESHASEQFSVDLTVAVAT